MIFLRRGESLRRYFHPGLEDGRTFVFWGRNYRTEGIPGPERSRTWVNQPEKFYGSKDGSGYRPGQARYGNAVSSYRPNFRDGSYREGVIAENDGEVVFEFQTPYIIAATPPNDGDWGIYDPGCRNGLVVRGQVTAAVALSVDRGATWHSAGELPGTLDLTDHAKGHRQYWLKLGRPAKDLVNAQLEIVTVCQANPNTFPRLKDAGTAITFAASGQALVSAGPNRTQVQPHIVDGAFDSPRVTLELAPPRGATATRLYAAGHVASSNPPDPAVRYQIEFSTYAGQSWQPVVKDWQIVRRDLEPNDFWSQSFCYGDIPLPPGVTGPVRIRFRNDGGKHYLRAEAHLLYRVPDQDATRVTFHWLDDSGRHTQSHDFPAGQTAEPWNLSTTGKVRTHWVEFQPIVAPTTR